MRIVLFGLLCLALVGLGWRVLGADAGAGATKPGTLAVPVEVGPVTTGRIVLRRRLSGTLEPAAELLVASQVAGRLAALHVDLGDVVTRGQIVATLDEGEFASEVSRAEAELAVAKASQKAAANAVQVTKRALERVLTLQEDGVASVAQLDNTDAEHAAAEGRAAVADAGVARAEAALISARIRFGYTSVVADWKGGDDKRVVAQRFVDEGGSLSPNSALLRIVELNPIVCAVQVPERDYGLLAPGQEGVLETDSYPGQAFRGKVERIAPVFRSSTRQARVELQVSNPEERLKPGMFVRATLELGAAEDATIVPYASLIERSGVTGVFELAGGAETVSWKPVETGIRDGDQIQILSPALEGRVVTLGQELCDEGSRVRVPGDEGAAATGDSPMSLDEQVSQVSTTLR